MSQFTNHCSFILSSQWGPTTSFLDSTTLSDAPITFILDWTHSLKLNVKMWNQNVHDQKKKKTLFHILLREKPVCQLPERDTACTALPIAENGRVGRTFFLTAERALFDSLQVTQTEYTGCLVALPKKKSSDSEQCLGQQHKTLFFPFDFKIKGMSGRLDSQNCHKSSYSVRLRIPSAISDRLSSSFRELLYVFLFRVLNLTKWELEGCSNWACEKECVPHAHKKWQLCITFSGRRTKHVRYDYMISWPWSDLCLS